MHPSDEQYRPDDRRRDEPPPQWGAPPAAAGTAGPRRARTGLVSLVALLTMLVLVAAFANQWATHRILHARVGLTPLLYEYSWLTYTWRFTPASGQGTAAWGAQLALVGVVLVVATLLVAAAVRGPVTFLRAFLGTWTAVVFATVVGAFVRGLIAPEQRHMIGGGIDGLGSDRATRALFGAAGPTNAVVVGSLALGLVTALVVAIVAVATRRAPAQPGAGEAPQPFFAPAPGGFQQQAPRPWQDGGYVPGAPPQAPAWGAPPVADEQRTTQLPPWSRDEPATRQPAGSHAEPTTQLPRVPEGGPSANETTQLPRLPEDGQATTQAPRVPEGGPSANETTQLPRLPEGGNPTTQFPRPPDDDDLAHLEDDPGRR